MHAPSRKLAIHGGEPIRKTVLPYGRHWIDEEDVRAVAEVLRGEALTTGPKVAEFEQAFASATGAAEAVAVSSGTAALHAAMHVLRLQPGDEVVVPPLTFAATANAVLYEGAQPVFADIDSDTLQLDPGQVAQHITDRTRAIVAVDYAGQPCDYTALRCLAERHGLTLVADACHAFGASDRGRAVGQLADLNVFSFHPVKHIATGEGGMVTTANCSWAQLMRTFRNHGITTDHRQREQAGSWHYQMVDLGYNYRISDIHCVLGLSQLKKQATWLAQRRAIARRYDEAFWEMPGVRPLARRPGAEHAYHLYVVKLELEQLRANRGEIFAALRAEGIGVNVHYIPVHLHPYYQKELGTKAGLCPIAEEAYQRILSLPLFPRMTDEDVEQVIQAVRKVMDAYIR